MEKPLIPISLKGSKRVATFLEENKVKVRIFKFNESTKNSQLAANVLGCTVAEIAKSIVFKAGDSAVVVVISGDKRVDANKLQALLGVKVFIANAEAVRDLTGYVIGGVAPFPHDHSVVVILDKSLTRFDNVWAASGTPNSVMQVKVDQIKEIVGVDFVDVAAYP